MLGARWAEPSRGQHVSEAGGQPRGVTPPLSGPRTIGANEEQAPRQHPSGPVTPSAREATVFRRESQSCPLPFGGPGRGSVGEKGWDCNELRPRGLEFLGGSGPQRMGLGFIPGPHLPSSALPGLFCTRSLTRARRSLWRRQQTVRVERPHQVGVRGPLPSSIHHLKMSGWLFTSDILAAQPVTFRVCFNITMEISV